MSKSTIIKCFLCICALLTGQYAMAQTVTFNYTGSVQTFSVAPGVFSVVVDAQGAVGGNRYLNYSRGGYGARVQCTLATTPGQILYIQVGQAGSGSTSTSSGGVGGYNGGGRGYYYSGGGGGASDVRLDANTLANRVVVAGGGGGAGTHTTSSTSTIGIGGAGGGLTGENGFYNTSNTSGTIGGTGGTQTAGGAPSTYTTGAGTGTLGAGGDGRNATTYGGGGGGGGYYGGGGGAYSGGGGGSSYTDATLCTSVTHTRGFVTSGNGSVRLTPICITPVGGTILGNAPICVGETIALSNHTGSLGGVWSTSNAAIASITNLGYVTGVTAGTTEITYAISYSCGNARATRVVTVNPLPTTITGVRTVCAGSTTTLNCAPGGGTWSSSNTFVANVGSAAGSFSPLTGVSAGTSSITYTLPTGCKTGTSATVYTTPIGIAGTLAVCQGAVTSLSNAVPGGVWSIGITSMATVDPSTGVTTGVSPGVPDITYTLPATGCQTIASLSVNALPAAFNVLGGIASYCAGGTGVPVGVDGSEPGVNYRLYNGSLPAGSPVAGTGSGFNFGFLTAAGTYTVQATNASSGCRSDLVGSATVQVNPLPTIHNVSTGGSFCADGSGLHVVLDHSEDTIFYQLYWDGIAIGGPVPGDAAGGPLDFGTQVFPGTYTVEGINGSTFCSVMMAGSSVITVNPLPTIFNLTGGGDYCPGDAGVRIGLDYSTSGVDYQLYNGTTPVGSAVHGADAAIDFGYQTASVDPYTVIAINTTTGCDEAMNGSLTVGTHSVPTPYAVTGGGTLCAGDAGIPVGIGVSDFGHEYRLYVGATLVAAPMAGTGGAFNFGNFTMPGAYTVVSTNTTTGCTANMTGMATIIENPLPIAQTITGGGNYCTGGTGVAIGLAATEAGIEYQLFEGSAVSGTAVMGTGGAISFGLRTNPADYTVVATNTSTTCGTTLPGRVAVAQYPLPTLYTVTGGGNYCATASGVRVGLNHSAIGIDYQLFRGSTAVGSPIGGSSSGIDFGLQTAPGTYTVMATTAATGCTAAMTGSATIAIDPVPNTYSLLASGSSICMGDAGVTLSLSGTEAGIDYQVFKSGAPYGPVAAGTGAALTLGVYVDPGVYTVTGTNASSGCSTNMSLSASIIIHPKPTQHDVTGGGTFCAGGPGEEIHLNGSQAGVSYQLMNGTTPVGATVMGTGTTLNFGRQTASGSYTVVARDMTSTCEETMNGTAAILVNSLPTAYTVTGGGSFCAGGAGMPVGLSSSATGVSYQLYLGSTAIGSPVTGTTGTPLHFGTFAAAGHYTVMANDVATGCGLAMIGDAHVVANPLPTVFTVFGGGELCAGGVGRAVRLSGSALGTNYQLYNGSTPVGGLVTATGSLLDFGPQTMPGSYTVVGSDAATHCTSNMASAASIAVHPLPATYAVTGGGNYCAGGAGSPVGLTNSDAGIHYQLYNGSTAVGSPMPGAGIPLDYGRIRIAGTYHVVATNPITGCNTAMPGTAVVGIIPVVAPAVTISTGISDTLCAGTVTTFTALPVHGGSSPTYEWHVNGTLVGAGSSYTYTPSHSDLVTLEMTTSEACATLPVVTGNKVLTVWEHHLPAVTLTADLGDEVCNGTTVTYSTLPTAGGTSPGYEWIVNSDVVATGATYSYVPDNADVLVVRMTSNYPCRLDDEAISNTMLMKVETPLTPTVQIKHSPWATFGPNSRDTLTAIVTGGGLAPTYQWYLNGGLLAGATGKTLVRNSYETGDSVSCIVSASSVCGGATAFNALVIEVRTVGVGEVGNATHDLRIAPNPSNGTFTVTCTLATVTDGQAQLELTNMLGQAVYTTTVAVTNGKVDEHIQMNGQLAAGMYLLTIRSGNDVAAFHLVITQ